MPKLRAAGAGLVLQVRSQVRFDVCVACVAELRRRGGRIQASGGREEGATRPGRRRRRWARRTEKPAAPGDGGCGVESIALWGLG